ncbi:hypothetical protein EV421DRAFT_1741632 [Armillaria borealis]|uniref:Uncharacterized protein n=1 Tax=Armillaria borealis TaxID=47425 RepID=A0AA39J0M2_9AGAR|nr:hypothetical protein EV421DRAFT_1741632 [Armillaria borealis]
MGHAGLRRPRLLIMFIDTGVHSRGLPRATNIPAIIRGRADATEKVEIKLLALGLSKGSIAAIDLAVYCLEKIVSLFLVSPLGPEKSMEVPSDSVYGILQLGPNNNLDDIASVFTTLTLPFTLKTWVPKRFDEFKIVAGVL